MQRGLLPRRREPEAGTLPDGWEGACCRWSGTATALVHRSGRRGLSKYARGEPRDQRGYARARRRPDLPAKVQARLGKTDFLDRRKWKR